MQGKKYYVDNVAYKIRPVVTADVTQLVRVRKQIDSETENMDRTPEESVFTSEDFTTLIQNDEKHMNLFIVVEIANQIVGFARVERNTLHRFKHQAEIGLGILREYWSLKIGQNILKYIIEWSSNQRLMKLNLKVLSTNDRAIHTYKKLGFQQEGILKYDKLLSDNKYYDTLIMAKLNF
ncbi:GNAT family N-acetyltransferase [Leuconostoc mesenteroides]|uniref:GNAT family N-acetyltransferase n=1 Tax=Leuconostoc mesenteroides TaxID=1245 RepID=UPI002114D7BD|nr:GNAT family N-acetyltransferase [Leuconostoc mesenteroides]UUE16981.1 GNAT family N-acetyltransferase [Leuconostoc mesenteroides]